MALRPLLLQTLRSTVAGLEVAFCASAGVGAVAATQAATAAVNTNLKALPSPENGRISDVRAESSDGR